MADNEIRMPPHAAELAARIDALRCECAEYVPSVRGLSVRLKDCGDGRHEGYDNAEETVKAALSRMRTFIDGL